MKFIPHNYESTQCVVLSFEKSRWSAAAQRKGECVTDAEGLDRISCHRSLNESNNIEAFCHSWPHFCLAMVVWWKFVVNTTVYSILRLRTKRIKKGNVLVHSISFIRDGVNFCLGLSLIFSNIFPSPVPYSSLIFQVNLDRRHTQKWNRLPSSPSNLL